jgi:hypothetical protein
VLLPGLLPPPLLPPLLFGGQRNSYSFRPECHNDVWWRGERRTADATVGATPGITGATTAPAQWWRPALPWEQQRQQRHHHQQHKHYKNHTPRQQQQAMQGELRLGMPSSRVAAGAAGPRRRTPTAAGGPSTPPAPPAGTQRSVAAPFTVMARGAALGAAGAAGAGGLFAAPSAALSLRLWPLPGRSPRAAEPRRRRKRVLIMMSNTGGGHKASADALKQAFEEQYGSDYEVRSSAARAHSPAGTLCCCWLLAAGCWLLAAGCWLLAAGCWLLAAGCWLLAAGCCLCMHTHASTTHSPLLGTHAPGPPPTPLSCGMPYPLAGHRATTLALLSPLVSSLLCPVVAGGDR